MRLRRRPFVSVLAIFLVALNVLWPLIAQARPTLPWILVPLCTIDGVTHYTELPAPKLPLEHSGATHEHCKMCVFGAERAFAAPSMPPALGGAAPEALSGGAPAAPRDSSFDSPARPRGPPISS